MPSIKFVFDGKNVEAQRAARRVASKLVKGVSDSTQKSIRNLIVSSIQEGIPPYEAARFIKPMIGLSDPQQAAVLNYRRELINSGLSSSAVDRKVERYIQKALRRRAKTIARTEIMESLNAGQEASWGQAQQQGLLGSDAKKRWIATSFGACPICKLLNGEVVGISKFFKSIIGPVFRPVAHPNCRCAVVPVPGKGVPAGPVTPVVPVRPKGAIGYLTKAGRVTQVTKKSRVKPTTTKPTTTKPKPQSGEYTGPEIRKMVAEVEASPDIAANQLLLAEKLQDMKFLKLKLERALKGIPTPRRFPPPTAKDIQKLVDIETGLLKEISSLRAKTGGRGFVHDLVLTKTRSNFSVKSDAGDLIPKDVRRAKIALSKDAHGYSATSKAAVGGRDAEAIEWMRKLFGDKVGDSWKVRVNNTGYDLVNGRSNYNPLNNVINLEARGGRHGVGTTIHEMSHVIEQWTGYYQESWKWVLKRSPGEKLKQLKKLFPNRNFQADEWAFEDRFLDPYMGKKYKSASEVLSMGLEYLYKDPVKFMKKDPEMFDFIIESLKKIKGGYNKPTAGKYWLNRKW